MFSTGQRRQRGGGRNINQLDMDMDPWTIMGDIGGIDGIGGSFGGGGGASRFCPEEVIGLVNSVLGLIDPFTAQTRQNRRGVSGGRGTNTTQQQQRIRSRSTQQGQFQSQRGGQQQKWQQQPQRQQQQQGRLGGQQQLWQQPQLQQRGRQQQQQKWQQQPQQQMRGGIQQQQKQRAGGKQFMQQMQPIQMQQQQKRRIRTRSRQQEPLMGQTTRTPQKYRITVNCQGFDPNTIRTNLRRELGQNHLILTCQDRMGQASCKRCFTLPQNCLVDKMQKSIVGRNQLVCEFPLKRRLDLDLVKHVVGSGNGKMYVAECRIPDFVDPTKVTVCVKGHELIVCLKDTISDKVAKGQFFVRTTLPIKADISKIHCVQKKRWLIVNVPVIPVIKGCFEVPIHRKLRHRLINKQGMQGGITQKDISQQQQKLKQQQRQPTIQKYDVQSKLTQQKQQLQQQQQQKKKTTGGITQQQQQKPTTTQGKTTTGRGDIGFKSDWQQKTQPLIQQQKKQKTTVPQTSQQVPSMQIGQQKKGIKQQQGIQGTTTGQQQRRFGGDVLHDLFGTSGTTQQQQQVPQQLKSKKKKNKNKTGVQNQSGQDLGVRSTQFNTNIKPDFQTSSTSQQPSTNQQHSAHIGQQQASGAAIKSPTNLAGTQLKQASTGQDIKENPLRTSND